MGIGETKDYVTISKRAFAELVDARFMLDALERAGVDNWEGYDEAQKIYSEMQEEE